MANFTPMKGRRKLKIPVHHVVDILQDIHSQGHSDQFAQAAKVAGASISVDPKTVNFVKSYLAQAQLHQQSETAAKVVGACPGSDPYDCPYQEN